MLEIQLTFHKRAQLRLCADIVSGLHVDNMPRVGHARLLRGLIQGDIRWLGKNGPGEAKLFDCQHDDVQQRVWAALNEQGGGRHVMCHASVLG